MILEFIKRHRRKFLVLLLVMTPFVMIGLGAERGVGQTRTTAPGRAGKQVVGVAQSGSVHVLGSIGQWLSSFLTSEQDLEHKQLRIENKRLREENARLVGILQENMRLRKLVGFKQKQQQYKLMPAKVVAIDSSPYFRVIKIHIQSEQPLKPRQPVVVSGGVVGQIHEVYGNFADVILLSDPRSHIDVISQRNRAHGVVQGLGHQRDYKAKIAYLEQKDAVKVGDVMVTSGMGRVFPRELIVGRVTEVKADERGLFQHATLRPSVDFSRLAEVFVIDMPELTLPSEQKTLKKKK